VFQAHGTSSGEIVSKFRQKTPKAYLSSLRNVYWLLLKDRIYREFDCVVAIGQAVASQLGKWPTKGLLGPTPSTMISNGVDTELFRFDDRVRERVRRDLGIASEAKVILSLCRLHQQKGLAVGLEAVRQALAEDPNLVYLIAGDGPQREELKGLISTLNLGAAVRLLGAIPREAVPGHLSAADALLFPTLRVEGLPITLLEALASGLPVITTPNGGDAALPCRRVAPMDAAATAREILDLIKSPRPQSSLLPEAFSLDHSGAEYIQLFERLLEARRRVRPSGTVAQEESPMTPHGLGGETRVPR
jgi:glycosyltransferase involved in cell wall biosynthesis